MLRVTNTRHILSHSPTCSIFKVAEFTFFSGKKKCYLPVLYRNTRVPGCFKVLSNILIDFYNLFSTIILGTAWHSTLNDLLILHYERLWLVLFVLLATVRAVICKTSRYIRLTVSTLVCLLLNRQKSSGFCLMNKIHKFV